MYPYHYALEVTCHTGAEVTTLYFSSFPPLITGAGDTPPSITFLPKLIQAGNYKVDAFDSGTTFGASRVGYGEAMLDNSDGSLDYLLDYGFDGRSVILRRGLPGADYPSGYTTIYTATVEQPAFDLDRISLRLRDNTSKLIMPLPQATYAGNNVLPDGLEGTADDLKGKNKPIVIGSVFNIQPPCVNTSKLIYQLSSGLSDRADGIPDWDAISNFDALTDLWHNTGEGVNPATIAVYDRGVALTKGADYSSAADMLGNAPSAGQFRLLPGGPDAYIRLGSTPTGAITADCADNGSVNMYAGVLIRRILETYLLWPSNAWSQADLDALDTAAPYVQGHYLTQFTQVDQLLDQICNSVGACYTFDQDGVLCIFRVEPPTGTVDLALVSADCAAGGVVFYSIKRKSTSDLGNGLPAWQVKVRYKRNYTPQKDLAGAASAERRAAVAEEWRDSVAADETIKIVHPISPEITFDTQLIAANQAEADRRLLIYKVRRDRLEIVLKVSDVDFSVVRIGNVATVNMNGRYGYDGSKKMLILGISTDIARDRLTLTIWG